MSITRNRPGRGVAIAVVATLLVGCSLTGGTLGGRETCWPAAEQRAPSIWRGILRIVPSGASLDTPEGDVIPLLPGSLVARVGPDGVGVLARGDDVLARTADDVTLFGGAGADGALVVCGIEEIHARR
ncbi:MAG TPA: hypothetical protein VFK35_13080 [Candidatus Limnocylindrales bacterium]|nr:hypothetical protein [Candidatus Limnocylindrales bacterium]